MRISQWLELLHLFTVVKDLYLIGELGCVSRLPRRQGLWGKGDGGVIRSANSFLTGPWSSGSLLEAFGPFITARQLPNRPIGTLRK
jgi:hypothetical protein